MKIALCGYKGKMGNAVYELLKDEYEIIGIEKNENKLNDYIDKVDLVVDFTTKETAMYHIYLCLDYHVNFICGTTGFNNDELNRIKLLCKKEKIKGIICYNFAIPINYLLKQFNNFSNYFKEIEYIDIHHISKIDKISGTTTLFLSKNDKIKIKSLKTNKNSITYLIKMTSKYDKIILTYQVNDRKAFALGVKELIKNKNYKGIVNLLC